ncbi:MAG: hypothetical protein AB2L12_14375 [Smithellaceae bacterium]
MKSPSSLPVQPGSRADVSRGIQKSPDGLGTAQTESSASSFQSRLDESIIDVYERSEVNAAVPDERTGVDRRTSSTRRQSSREPAPLKSGAKVTDVNVYSTNQRTNDTYNKTEKTAPAIFSPSQEKGKLVDIWA